MQLCRWELTLNAAKFSVVRNESRLLGVRRRGIFTSMNSDVRENRWRVNGELLFVAEHRFAALVQTIFNRDAIQKEVLLLIK